MNKNNLTSLVLLFGFLLTASGCGGGKTESAPATAEEAASIPESTSDLAPPPPIKRRN